MEHKRKRWCEGDIRMTADVEEAPVKDEFEDFHPGRRMVLVFQISSCSNIRGVVLDSASTLEEELAIECAAMLVPYGRESEWMYSSEGGQWQLLASAGVSRLILFSRNAVPHRQNSDMAAWNGKFGKVEKGRARKRLKSTDKCVGELIERERESASKMSFVDRASEHIKDEGAILKRLRLAGEHVSGQTGGERVEMANFYPNKKRERSGEKGRRAQKRLRSAGLCISGRTEGKETDMGNDMGIPEQTGEQNRVEAECWQENYMVKSSFGQGKKKRRLKQKHRCKERRDRRLPRNEQLLQDALIDCRQWPLLSSISIYEDEELKRALGSLVLALAPKLSLKSGVRSIPFVTYSDNVVRRIVVEETFSDLTGLMRVEDVELESDNNEIQEIGNRGSLEVESSSQIVQSCSHDINKCTSHWRRRLIFRRMPNLIQTEVVLNVSYDDDYRSYDDDYRRIGLGKEGMTGGKRCLDNLKKNGNFSLQVRPHHIEAVDRQVDHSRLVHKYLPPIVAGFVLIASCLDACLTSKVRRARVLSIGVGGGAFPIFLQKHFSFHIQVVDLDEEVLNLARMHFGLREDAHFQVTVGDGLAIVEDVAARAIKEGVVDDQLKKSWMLCLCTHGPARLSTACIPESDLIVEALHGNSKPSFSDIWKSFPASSKHKTNDLLQVQLQLSSSLKKPVFGKCKEFRSDSRLELVIVDVDGSDAQLSLSSPPLPFLEQRFLLSAKVALQEGGMLVINVVPFGKKPYEVVVKSLKAVFAEVYEIIVDDDINRIVFALPTPVLFNHHLAKGCTVELVKKVVGDRLVQRIQRLENI